jgi:hypothetical protein
MKINIFLDEVEIQPVSGRLEIRVVDRSNDGSTQTAPTTRETRRSDHKGIYRNINCFLATNT